MAQNDEEIELGSDSEGDYNDDTAATSTAGMTPAQQRLFQLRLKMNEARKKNHQEVIEENKRKHKDPRSEATQKKRERLAKQEELKTLAEERGLDAERAKLLNTTAYAASVDSRTKKKKYFDWDMYNDDSQYRAHKKRVRTLPRHGDEPVAEPVGEAPLEPGEALLVDAGAVSSTAHQPRDAAINRLVDNLHAQAARRSKFSRHRVEHADADVDYINDRNKNFNKKIARHFDQYTAEIRENLERGTAI